MNDAIRMQLSAFVDGELPDNEAEMLLRRMSQDVELRQEVAEYMALSRVIRGELGVAGADRLYERVAAAIDDRPAADMENDGHVAVSRSVKPLLGFAVAASVALLAIFGLQQSNSVVEPEQPVATEVVAVPDIDAQLEQRRHFFRNHAKASSQLGASGLSSRLVTLRFSAEVGDESEIDKDSKEDKESQVDDAASIDAINNTDEASSQP